eukprot:CAMPEP_0117681516 /NCGR_PEP_ID=MMETSP0804-20121206/19034_1 /TAXON_ID=1074897 /ORGANISM="Tetraselmis astigmatica, Strain CCMP880" /LENGTH=397 /DNA_ID=CAMNT_0005491299 /DNA_START=187 /DNA_END=1378 /DNA_ORIENTATION=-
MASEDNVVLQLQRGLSNLGSGSVDFTRCSAAALQELFLRQQRFLNYFFSNLEYDRVQAFTQACLECKGVICFTGVGKSGFIAQKITQTLVSTGTKAVFLSPTDALHGDIGIIGPDDLVVCFSKSGGTEELLKLLPYAKAKGAKLVSVASIKCGPPPLALVPLSVENGWQLKPCNYLLTCHRGSKMEQMCDMAVILPLERELCPFDLAPVTSTAIQMLFGDTVAIALMQAHNLTQDEYAMNHPAGRIGKRLILRVSDVMVVGGELPKVAGNVKVVDTLMELSSKGCGCVLVVDENNHLLGTFTDGDLRRSLQASGTEILDTPVAEVMHKSPTTISITEKAVDAMSLMEHPRRLTFLPVLADGNILVGLVTLMDWCQPACDEALGAILGANSTPAPWQG